MTNYKALYGRVWRKEHAEQERAKRRERYAKLKAAGICVVCCKKPARPGKAKCAECAIRHSMQDAARRKREQEEGIE
ncbi:MAG: hypothetical protein IKF99_13870 [Oscillospiraceae bacterium]|nr:hypothetical protein [Oscillospiraceae bacterium]